MTLESLLPRTFGVLQAGIDRGFHFGGQIAIYRDGESVVDAAFGMLGPADSPLANEPMRRDHILCWRSAGKPLTAIAVLQLRDLGLVELDTEIDEYVPGSWYTRHYDDSNQSAAWRVATPTIRNLLTHTTGWEPPATGWPDVPWHESLRRIYDAPLRPGAQPGQTAAYDPQASWFVLGEILETSLDNDQSSAEVVRSRVTEPADVECWMVVPASELEAVEPRLAPQFNTARGQSADLGLTSTNALTHPSPGSSFRGPIASLAKIYDILLQDDCGTSPDNRPSLLTQATAQEMTARHREAEPDLTFQHTLDFGLGVIVDSNRYGASTLPYGFGVHSSEHAFGHGGAQCAMGFADPAHNLAVAWVLNGLPGEPRHNRRNREINTAIYEDLGLA